MERKQVVKVDSGSGVLWFIGFLFTIPFAELVGWKIVWALFIWPYYLGLALK